VVGEIGGGYGGMAYYLLCDGGRLTYIDFDLPESIALTSYYLLKAFPSSDFLLYGEGDLSAEALAASDIVLLPLFEVARMPAGSVDLMFSSHVMGDLSDSALAEYLGAITHMSRKYFLYFGDSRAAERISNWGGGPTGCFRLLEVRSTGWNRHRAPKAKEGEYLYQIGHH
jgi:putative sugar O-methyltransferase